MSESHPSDTEPERTAVPSPYRRHPRPEKPAKPGKPAGPGKPTHRVRETLATTGVAILAFAVGLAVFNNVLMPRIVHRAGEVRVPDLANLTVEQAQSTLGSTGLVLSRAGERCDPSVPPRRRAHQYPA